MCGLLAFSEGRRKERGKEGRVIFGHGHLLPHHFPKHFARPLALSESAPVAVGKHMAHILIRVVHPTKPKPVPPLRQDRSMYILPACSCCQRRGPPPPRPLSVRGIVFRAIGFSELLFYDWKTESKHGRQSRMPKPELEPTNERWFSGVYHYAIKTTMSPEKRTKGRKDSSTARVMDASLISH